MKKFEMLVPVAKGKPERDIIEEFMRLIDYGSENAISRKLLVQKCVAAGLIDKDLKDKDRAMRNMMSKAKIDYAICNIGKGYFRPTPRDKPYIDRFVAEREKQARSIFKSIASVKKIQADIKAGRINE